MTDERIVDLYWARSEDAISETSVKYGKYCFSIANGILRNHEDSDECVNDTYMRAWNSMPEARPSRLSPYLGRITRNLAINRFNRSMSAKRGGGASVAALDELGECVAGSERTESVVDEIVLKQTLDDFLGTLRAKDRIFFVNRYFNAFPISDIAKKYGVRESAVKVSLFRSRKKLRAALAEIGVNVSEKTSGRRGER